MTDHPEGCLDNQVEQSILLRIADTVNIDICGHQDHMMAGKQFQSQ